MARSRTVAWAGGLDWPALLVRPPMGGATPLRHNHRRCRARYDHHRRCSRLRPGTASSRPVLVLGRPLRRTRVLGLLLLESDPTNELYATPHGWRTLSHPRR